MNYDLIPVVIITFAALVTFLVSLYNFFTAPIVGRGAFIQETEPQSKISILIPARNEENNIGNCLESCITQDYTNLEIIVLDDHSEDRTAQVVMSKTLVDPRVRLLSGKELPSGWLGKNWACHQMAGISTGEYLLFIDADVTLGRETVSRVISTVKSNKIGMFSVFPTQILTGFGASTVIPIMNWLLLNFLPLKQVFKSDSTRFVAANGQFILFSKETYQKSGGHAAVKGMVVEDMELARNVKRSGIKLMTALGGDLIKCKMYSGFWESIKGFTKNFYPGFGISGLTFIIMISSFLVIYLLPFVSVFFSLLWLPALILVLLSKVLISRISRSNLMVEIITHPFQMVILYITGLKSVYLAKTGRLEWKGRIL